MIENAALACVSYGRPYACMDLRARFCVLEILLWARQFLSNKGAWCGGSSDTARLNPLGWLVRPSDVEVLRDTVLRDTNGRLPEDLLRKAFIL